jgi:hypothetical protein
LFSEVTKEATLWLTFPGDLPKRALKMKANLQGRWYEFQFLWIFLLLTMGALFSLIVRHWVPNTQRKRELKEQIRRVRLKIDGFSEDIEPDLRVLTQVQVRVLDAQRKATWTFMPDYVTVAAQCSQGIAMLERRVDLIEEIDSVCESERVKWDACPPPSQIDRVEDLLRTASEGLRKAQLSEQEFIAIKAQVDKAKALTELMGSVDDALGKDLATRVRLMREELAFFKEKDAYEELRIELEGMFDTIEESQSQSGAGGEAASNVPGGEAVSPLRYSLIDYNLQALGICRDYIWLVAGTKDPMIQQELKKIRSDLLQHLARQSWSELRQARLLLKQFREHRYAEEAWKAVQNKAIDITYEPKEVRRNQLVQFRASFRQEELNWSGARECIIPDWDFGDGSKRGRGCWTISHFFSDPSDKWRRMGDWVAAWARRKGRGEKLGSGEGPESNEAESEKVVRVRVRFERAADCGGSAPAKDGAETAVEVKVPVTESSDDRKTRTVSEVVGLLVSISVPLVSLIAGAKEQLGQSPAGGALTVFLLGFSSDALISVFKQRISPSESKEK